ncbi:NIPSNAP family protein [Corallococcus praedator]|uniref:NIPSNAP family protein n=1 Tax=Corallococcus praedator TaxID=2316724 RepID=A0ABX9QEK9_9BACT|nr:MULTISPECIES: NIPSNAP family protein [Corallococcus]RKH12346.1 NIPSNAP family protein [Corallococcus sp. CA047B]RKH27382.1 NIPSNAP family protein [Corallococcus sp. CA031C]RKI05848.1 NIPSNAP family protein [Corallococcus praedator]
MSSTPTACCSVLELRQYTLHPGQRDVLITLFDQEFVEAQEAVGMHIVGQFRDEDRPDRFVWMRGFPDMASRSAALGAFYGGPVWKAHRGAANATMQDSDNVLLLRPVRPDTALHHPGLARQPVEAVALPDSRVEVTLCFLKAPADEGLVRFFEQHVRPALTELGARFQGLFQTEPAENTFPALPVRTGEHFLAWLTVFPSAERHREHREQRTRSTAWTEQVLHGLHPALSAPLEHLTLAPTLRSQLR